MAFVSSSKGYDGANNTTVATAALAVSAGSLIVVTVTSQEAEFSSSSPTGVTDTAGNTYTALTMRTATGTGPRCRIFYAYNVTGNAANVATVTWDVATRYKSIVQQQFDLMDTTSGVFIAENGATEFGGGAGVVNSGNMVSSDAGVVVAVATSSNDRSWSPDAGYTEVYDANITEGSGSSATQYKIEAASGTFSVTATPSADTNMLISAAVFKAGTAAPAPTGRGLLLGVG